MNKYGLRIKAILADDTGEIFGAMGIDPFSEVKDKGQLLRGCFLLGGNIASEGNRMCPAILAQYTDREILFENGFFIGIVVTHGGDATEKVPKAAPAKTYFSRDLSVLSHCRGVRRMDVTGPFQEIVVAASTQAGKQSEL